MALLSRKVPQFTFSSHHVHLLVHHVGVVSTAERRSHRRVRQGPIDGRNYGSDLIVESGTNEVFQRDTTWQAALDNEVGVLASTQCVIFVNVSSSADWFGNQKGLPLLVHPH